MTKSKFDLELDELGEEYRALINLTHVHSATHLIEWVTKYDPKHVPVAVDPELLYDLRNKALSLVEEAKALFEQVTAGSDVTRVALEENKAKQADIRKVKEIFKL